MTNPDRQGHQYPPAAPYQVSREAIREFALAVHAEHPAHHDLDAAQVLGHRDLIAPPSFAVIIAQRAEAAVVDDAEAGIDFARVVHAEERFTHHSPILAGDTLSAQVTLDRIRTMGAGAMVTTVVQISAEDGAARSTVTSTLLVRNDPSDSSGRNEEDDA